MEHVVSKDKYSVQRNRGRHAVPPSKIRDIVVLVCQNRERETRDSNIFLHLHRSLQLEF